MASSNSSETTMERPQASQGSVHLDALRGAAALLVFANHTRALYFSSPLQNGANQQSATVPQAGARLGTEVDGELKIASSAVIIFFVLSGYLVGGGVLRSVRSGRWRWADYLTKRLTRLLTVLVPAVVLGAALDIVGLHHFGPASIYAAPHHADIVVAADLLQRLKPSVLLGNLLFLQNILVPIEGTNVSLWSLANEFWYYLAFPLGVIGVLPGFPLWRRGVALFSSAAILWFVGFSIAVLFPVWMMGAFVGTIPNPLSARQAKFAAVLTTLLLLGGILVMRVRHVHAIPADYVIGVLSSALLYTLIPQREQAKHNLYRRVSGFFSQISYSLYLFHLPLAVFLCAMLNTPWRPLPKTAHNLLLFGLRDAFILGLVYLLWIAFESRTDSVRRFLFRQENKPPASILPSKYGLGGPS